MPFKLLPLSSSLAVSFNIEAWNCNATFRMKVLRKPNEQM